MRVFLLLLWSSPLWSWSNHALLTRLQLQAYLGLKDKVAFTPLNDCLKSLGYKSLSDFQASLQLHPHYSFDLKLGEHLESAWEPLEIMATYSDEPDWGMDQELFATYPELWKTEYDFMGGKKGLASQSFRHMYWQSFSLWSPLQSFKLPLKKLFQSMGEAPQRAAIFYSLAQSAWKNGHPYWAFRFLGNSLHYLQDLTNPFHSTQIPTVRFFLLPFTDSQHGKNFSNFIAQVTQLIIFSHLAAEDVLAYLMQEKQNYPELPKVSHRKLPIQSIAKELATRSAQEASDFAGMAYQFLPTLTAQPFTQWHYQQQADRLWWAKVKAKPRREKELFYEKYLELVSLLDPFLPYFLEGFTELQAQK